MNAKIERTMADVQKVNAVVASIDDAMDNILPDNGQLECFNQIQLLMEVLIDELRSVTADVEELARDSEVVDAFLASSVIERNRK